MAWQHYCLRWLWRPRQDSGPLVLTVDVKASKAIISGDDALRYTFGAGDWIEQQPPVRGHRVDFVTASGQRATEVYVDVETPTPSTDGQVATPPSGAGTSVNGLDDVWALGRHGIVSRPGPI